MSVGHPWGGASARGATPRAWRCPAWCSRSRRRVAARGSLRAWRHAGHVHVWLAAPSCGRIAPPAVCPLTQVSRPARIPPPLQHVAHVCAPLPPPLRFAAVSAFLLATLRLSPRVRATQASARRGGGRPRSQPPSGEQHAPPSPKESTAPLVGRATCERGSDGRRRPVRQRPPPPPHRPPVAR